MLLDGVPVYEMPVRDVEFHETVRAEEKNRPMNNGRLNTVRFKVFAVSMVMGFAVWLFDAVNDYLFFYRGSFLSGLVWHPPVHEIYTRTLMFLFFIIYGVIFSRMLVKQAQTEMKLKEANEELENRVSERTAELREANTRLLSELQEREKMELQLRLLSSRLLTAQENERKRISSELHDELGQALTALKFRFRFIKNNLFPTQEKPIAECSEGVKDIDRIAEEVRRLSWDLSPRIIQDLGISKALRWMVDNLADNYGILTHSEIADIDGLFSEDAQINVYRIIQEALTNTLKHAGATSLALAIEKQTGSIAFTIEDDGKGFDAGCHLRSSRIDKGLGLTTISERVRMLGGVLSISSKEGMGTRISFTVPSPRELTSAS